MKTLQSLGIIIALAFSLYWGGCSYRNVDRIKAASPVTWAAAGFQIVGYEGYQIGDPFSPGGKVWYVVQRNGDPKTRYHGYISKWGTEYHVYNLKAIDALTPSDN